MDVLNELKPGLDEKLYERVMVIELRRRGHVVEAQREFPVFYRDKPNEAHIAQMIGYLTITGLELALLLNFKNARLEWKRVVREEGKRDSVIPDLHG